VISSILTAVPAGDFEMDQARGARVMAVMWGGQEDVLGMVAPTPIQRTTIGPSSRERFLSVSRARSEWT
jgi:hypothetical protein